jgi:class 3 adenylate cyclase
LELQPDIDYARSGDVSIAYQVAGDGPVDLVVVPFLTNIVSLWEHPLAAGFFTRLASFSRLILLDKRGTGLSDRPHLLPTLETAMDDVRAVMDAVASERAVLLGSLAGGQMTALFAATYPERTVGLVLYNTVARVVSAPDYPWGLSREEWRQRLTAIRERWGRRDFLEQLCREIVPNLADDEEFRRWFVMHYRLCASPSAAHAFYRMWMETDIRDVLPAIRVPTIALYRQNRRDPARHLAEQIPGATAVELPGMSDGLWTEPGVDEEVERFVAGVREEAEPERVLVTILFTDIVGSTAKAAELGDQRWRKLLNQHHTLVRSELLRFRGREIDVAGDGFFASFDGPARAIRCACAITDAAKTLGLEIRAGLHTGECELFDGKISGIAVHLGARIATEARPGEVVVSSTVKDLVAGSGIRFADRGPTAMKGVPGEWRLYGVEQLGNERLPGD